MFMLMEEYSTHTDFRGYRYSVDDVDKDIWVDNWYGSMTLFHVEWRLRGENTEKMRRTVSRLPLTGNKQQEQIESCLEHCSEWGSAMVWVCPRPYCSP